jgi:hypothetical protein
MVSLGRGEEKIELKLLVPCRMRETITVRGIGLQRPDAVVIRDTVRPVGGVKRTDPGPSRRRAAVTRPAVFP